MSALGPVSRVTPVQTALRNCTGDEDRPFGFGDQVADPKPPQAAAVKSRGGERCGKAGTVIPTGKVERGERTTCGHARDGRPCSRDRCAAQRQKMPSLSIGARLPQPVRRWVV